MVLGCTTTPGAPGLSTRKTAVTNWGHSWVVLGVIVRLPLAPDQYFCLPILFRLYISKQTVAKKGGPYRKRSQLAVEMLQVLCTAYEHRHFHVVADLSLRRKDRLSEPFEERRPDQSAGPQRAAA